MYYLIHPFHYHFMLTALLAASLVGITCATLGVYVVLRRMAFIGDAIAHTSLPGLVGAYLLGFNLLAGALVAGLATALGIGWLSRRESLREDTAIGIVFTGMFAVGIVLIGITRSFRDLSHILFGNVLGVSFTDVGLIAIVAVVTLGALALAHKELELTSYDPDYGRHIGIPVDRLRYLLLILLALAVIAAIQAVGVILTSAMLVTPAATASLLTRRINRMMVAGAGIASIACLTGLYGSFYLDIPSGAAIVLVATLLFVAASVWQALRRVAAQRRLP
ncbi:MAG TPA: metal ABC transporter permease [Phycisphaerae bacterium]|nr:metal ABC transporter permease [Phycisphaerae bacterium]